jgi:hypothetical protein
MESWVGPFICTTRNVIAQSFRALPVILGGATLLLGLTQGNFNFLFFFAGLFILAPTAALCLNALTELWFVNVPWWLSLPKPFWAVPSAGAEQCSIITTKDIGAIPGDLNVVPSYWMTMMSFFFAYLLFNAIRLYTRQADSKAPEHLVSARKSQAIISIILISVVTILTFIARYATSCETGFGVLVSIALGGSLGYGWYNFMRACGLGRLDDLFGISNRLLPYQSKEDMEPSVCVPSS